MATPITGGTAFDFGAAAQATTAQLQTTTTAAVSVQQPTRVESAGYTVKLSDDAQVRLLSAQGQTVPQIAIMTDLSTQAVNGYLGITQAPATAASNK
jgi:hypothetical protein